MNLSSVAIAFARSRPALTRRLLRAWARWIEGDPERAHWLFLHLKDATGLRLLRTARLLDGQQMRVDPFDSVGDAILREGCFEPETVLVFERLLRPRGRIVDAGAHAGQYTLIGSRLLGVGGEVHPFEPDPQTFELLEANVVLNRCSNVILNPCALSDQAGTATLHLAPTTNIGGNSLAVTDCTTGASLSVRTLTLDGYLGEDQDPDLIKADVEGAEWPLLRGAERTLHRAAPHLILEFSVHTRAFAYGTDELVAWLAARGYRLYDMGPVPLKPHVVSARSAEWYNVLAVHQDRIPSLRAEGLL